MLEDKNLCWEFCDAAGLERHDLNDYFDCLASDTRQQRMEQFVAARKSDVLKDDRKLVYTTFIEHLKNEGVTADKRSVLHVISRLKDLESRMDEHFERLETY